MYLKKPSRMSRAPEKPRGTVGENIKDSKKRKDKRLGSIMDQITSGRRRSK